ncbi:unnamed protein product [Camellia sinensis]
MTVAEERGSIAFSTTYRPPVPLDVFSCPLRPTSKQDELPMTDEENYNYNGQEISSAALKTILKRENLASEGKEADVNIGRLSGMVFVSERQEGLELLHIALRFNDDPPPKPEVYCLADVFGKDNFSGVRMEDSGCIAGDNLVYVTTKDPAPGLPSIKPISRPEQPTASPHQIAVASFQGKRGGWNGEIEDLHTDIFVMNVEKPFNRHKVVRNGWEIWGVFRVNLSNGTESRVTPHGIQAITPAAINATTVAVATIRQESEFLNVVRVEAQYRHIEIFDSTGQQQTIQITQKTVPKADHFNPFVIDGGKRIGYHRCKSHLLKSGEDIQRNTHKLESPHPDVGLFRVPGIFPTFSKDGSKLAFVDNEFKAVWVADSKGLRIVYHVPKGTKLVFRSTRDGGDERYKNLYIMENAELGEYRGEIKRLTTGHCIDTHCQWSPSGDWIVFSSTRDKPKGAPEKDNDLDPGYFAVFLVKVDNPLVVVRVMESSEFLRVMQSKNNVAGHVNHPFFSSDGKSIVVTADLAAVSVDPVSLPRFLHSVRPYGDIFTFDIDQDDINKNKNVKKFKRITQSRYENSTGTWTMFSTQDPNAAWSMLLNKVFVPSCPYARDGGESWHMTGHLCIPKRCC